MISRIYHQLLGCLPYAAASQPEEVPLQHKSFPPDWIQSLDQKWVAQCRLLGNPDGTTLALQIGDGQIVLKMGSDITKEPADFIVNAANEEMLGGGGVDGAIGKAGGDELLYFRQQVPEIRKGVRCPVGEVRVTDAGRLLASFCIHAVGPRFDLQRPAECRSQLSHAYSAALNAAQDCIERSSFQFAPIRSANDSDLAERANKLQQQHRKQFVEKLQRGTPLTISFPTISTGIFGYPKQEAAILSLHAALEYLISHQGKPGVKSIQFIFLANQADIPCYLEAFSQLVQAAKKQD